MSYEKQLYVEGLIGSERRFYAEEGPSCYFLRDREIAGGKLSVSLSGPSNLQADYVRMLFHLLNDAHEGRHILDNISDGELLNQIRHRIYMSVTIEEYDYWVKATRGLQNDAHAADIDR